ncbi:DUF4352 domain-containing protein [Oceanobacillus damuensis]|uniref:DUF4352 domain-containing protein n=1 Tax=Oceanobacillus damuensis TaxID=937928 RepID=UPI00082A659B|nr:DUF4352 domain-containing protein [Oceanobacillus damuensis]
MKKLYASVSIIFLVSALLAACSDSEAEEKIDLNNTETQIQDEGQTTDSSSETSFNSETEDQENLTIGETGRFDSDLTTYEITLENAKIVEELDDTPSQLAGFIILDLTIKNTGEETQSVRDLLYGLEVTSDLERTGYQDYADSFESVEEMAGELKPGDEVSGQWVTMIAEGDTQYFRLRSGVAGSGSSNQVTWIIASEEAKQ